MGLKQSTNGARPISYQIQIPKEESRTEGNPKVSA